MGALSDGSSNGRARKGRMPYFRMWVGDFLSSSTVALMGPAEVGAYCLLLMHEWQSGPLPKDPGCLARLARMDLAELEAAWAGPLGECFEETDAGYVNARLEDERAWADGRSEASAKANRIRWGSDRSPIGLRPDIRSDSGKASGSDPNQNQNQSQKKTEKSPPPPKPGGLVPKGKPTTQQAALVEWFQEAWRHHRDGAEYVPSKADYVAAAKLLKEQRPQEIRYRAETMLLKQTSFWVENASVALLASKWNGLVREAV